MELCWNPKLPGWTKCVLMLTRDFEAVGTKIEEVGLNSTVLRVIKTTDPILFDEPTFAKVKECSFTDGIIEVDVKSTLLPDAPAFARGFLGVAFRISEDNDKFEGIYIRPTNGRCEIQLRRNRSTQYFSYPEYKFDRLREEAPGEYESYVDIGLDEWIHLKIEVMGEKAKLYVNNSVEPALIVNDLKHGKNLTGSVGLWVEIGTDGLFKNLNIHKTDGLF